MNKKIFTFFLAVFISTRLFADDPVMIELREVLAKRLNDIERAEEIDKNYKKLTEKADISQKVRGLFKQWIVEKSYFLGSKYYDHDLVYRRLPWLKKNKKFQESFKRFVHRISSSYTLNSREVSSKHKKRVTIVYNGSAGGGHKSPATALAHFLQKRGHAVQFIDADVLIDHYSPTVKGYTRTEIYSEIFQKEGNPKKASALRKIIDKRHKPENRKYMRDLKRKVRKFKPDHIFAVAHHRPEFSYISYQLGVPMTYVHTDHVFNKNLFGLLAEQVHLKKKLITFSALSSERAFVENVFDKFKLKGKELPFSIRKQLVRLDFPVRESFHPVTKKQIEHIRNELHIPQFAIVCKLAMGQTGFENEIKDILKRLIDEEKKVHRPIYVFVVCGTNEHLKKDIEKFAKKHLSKHSHVHIIPRGYMNEQEMAQVDQISTVWMTKPGGSTCAELVETQKQMLYVFAPHHVWEKTNAKYLRGLNLAAPLSTKKSLVHQIKRRVVIHNRMNLKKLPRTEWQQQAIRILHHQN